MSPCWFLSIGYLFVAMRIQINGIELIFPTCVGYGLIALASWQLRESVAWTAWAIVLSLVLAIYTFPMLFLGMLRQDVYAYDTWAFWPSVVCELLLYGVIAEVINRLAVQQQHREFRRLTRLTIPIALASFIAWYFFPQTTNLLFVISSMIYVIPAFYLSAIAALAAKRLAHV